MIKETKKILFIIPRLAQGGAERTVVDQINNLNPDFFDCWLCTLEREQEPSSWNDVHLPPEKMKQFFFRSFFDFKTWKNLIDWLRQEKFDIIYSNLFVGNTIGRLAGRLANIPHLIAVEQNVYINRSYWERLINFCFSFISDYLVAISQSVKNYLITKEKIPAVKIRVIYNGVDLEKYRFQPDARQRLRKEFGLTDNDILVLSVGRVSKQKGYDILIETAAKLENNIKNRIHFFIAGIKSEKLMIDLEKKIHEFSPEGKINFLGPRNDIPELLSAADIFFMPSCWEGFGLVLVEAMAAEKPVVVSDIGPLREILDNGRFGLIGKTTEEFAGLIGDLLQNPKKRSELAMLGRQRAEEFSLQKNITEITKLFLEQ